LFSFSGLIFPEIALEEKRVDRDGPRRPRRNKLEMTCATIGLPQHPETRNFPAAASRDVRQIWRNGRFRSFARAMGCSPGLRPPAAVVDANPA
jgi:hypothetical protein